MRNVAAAGVAGDGGGAGEQGLAFRVPQVTNGFSKAHTLGLFCKFLKAHRMIIGSE